MIVLSLSISVIVSIVKVVYSVSFRILALLGFFYRGEIRHIVY